MQDDCRIFGNGKSSKRANKNQHHKFPSGLGYPKPEGKDEGESGLMVKCTPKRGHNALFFTPLEVFIML